AKTGVARPQDKAFSNYWGPFGDVFTKAIEGGDDAKTTIAEACAAMDAANK
ncbi:MAG: ABC transporter substrate-binding protein, partial [Herpetosiphonaceae bacterium]|nr:ABC transporter substrate-binding protein [Herpetosiphonaceae bacterium]